MNEEEYWSNLPELGDSYQVSNYGRVRAVARSVKHSDGKVTNHKERVLKQGVNKKGYAVVWPSFNGRKKSLVVHRLVAKACVPNPLNLPEVNHIDEVKTNNYWHNLEWCDTQYNVDYSQSGEATFLSPADEIVYVRNLSKFSRDNGLSNGKLSCLIKGTRKSHKGWRLYEAPRD